VTESPLPAAAATQRVYRVQVIDRIFEILDLMARSKGELGSTDLAQKLGLHKSTVHRLLAVLERHRFVEKNHETAKYNLGWRLFELGTAAASRMGLYGLARPYLAALAKKTCETAHLGIVNHGEVMSIVSVEADRSLRLPATVGRRSPLYCTSQGKAMLAFSDPAQAEEIIRSLNMKALTRNTITKAPRLHDELARIRKAGYAVDNEELEEGLRCIGAPVFDHAGQPIAAVSIAGPAYRVGGGHLPRLTEAVIQTSRQLSSALGFQRAPDAAPSRRRQAGLGA
jgi:IclR family transcriptional regulator, KDG regulon repressor